MTSDEARDLVFKAARVWGKQESYLEVEEKRLQKGRGDEMRVQALRDSAEKALQKLEDTLYALESVIWDEGQMDGYNGAVEQLTDWD